jgi:sulfatase modifying factor 1
MSRCTKERSPAALVSLGIASFLFLLVIAPSLARAAVTFDWVRVGAPGNAPDTEVMTCCDGSTGTTGFGAVAYEFEISKYETTNAQYAAFLNAVDPLALNNNQVYSTLMSSQAVGGILRTLNMPYGEKYSAKPGMANKPAVFVNMWGAMRFANWVHNGQGRGGTEYGAYTLEGPNMYPLNALTVVRNWNARVFLPTEDEFYKAAYYDGDTDSYYDYPTGSNTEMACTTPTIAPNAANCNFYIGTVVDVGSYPGSESPWGTYDQAGNALEWSETIFQPASLGLRAFRGGAWGKEASFNASFFSYGGGNPTSVEQQFGFRLARAVTPPVPTLAPWGLSLLSVLLVATGVSRGRQARA